ncbi:N-6 DNA methylase [Chitinophaga sp. CF418]|uniref:restriction endonuclease subunit M n=1 Tax=Chitinophaga sp. CF418 TaxID=1855287 RepID=UPI00091CFD10|nr:N-6 DNA methylase [Chitinophaga sp. CF418]SHN45722.1 type I restriction enzyme M protein [Chitinophaga sp. CF418]
MTFTLISANKINSSTNSRNIQPELSEKELLIGQFINKLVYQYGYTPDQIRRDVVIRIPLTNSAKYAVADIAIWDDISILQEKAPTIVIEFRTEKTDILTEDYFRGIEFAKYANAIFFIAANLRYIKVFKVNTTVQGEPGEEISDIPKPVPLLSTYRDTPEPTPYVTSEELSTLFFRCHTMLRNNERLTPEAAFEEMTKVLLIKHYYESNHPGEILSPNTIGGMDPWETIWVTNDEINSVTHKMEYLFDEVKKHSGKNALFDWDDKLKISPDSFIRLSIELRRYNSFAVSDHIQGEAFEKFISNTFKGRLGEFFTPRLIVDHMIDILSPQEGETICDPCCGSGGFLIQSHEYICQKIKIDINHVKKDIKEHYHDDHYLHASREESFKIDQTISDQFSFLNAELNTGNPKSRLHKLSFDTLTGVEVSTKMAQVARINMVMHGCDPRRIYNHNGLWVRNEIPEGEFDIVFANPPMGVLSSHSPESLLYQPNGFKILSQYRVGEYASTLEVLFIERCLNLLKPGGRMGIILSEKILNDSKLQKAREFIESKAKILGITALPKGTLSLTSMKPNLVFLKKFTVEEKENYARVKDAVTNKIAPQYDEQLNEIGTRLNSRNVNKEERKELRNKQKQLLQEINDAINSGIKDEFDYSILISNITADQSSSNTAMPIEAQLSEIAKIFKEHRIKNNLWTERNEKIRYDIFNNAFQRVTAVGEPEIFYGKDSGSI